MSIMFLKEKLTNTQSFEKIVQTAEEISSKRTDRLICDVPNSLEVLPTLELSMNVPTLEGVENIVLPTTPWALYQLTDTKLGVPPRYVQKCGSSGHSAELAEHLNMWISELTPGKRSKSVDYLVRQYDDRIDAVFSKNYTAFDSPAILGTIQDSLNLNDWNMVGSYISNERLHVRMIQDKMLNVEGEDLFPGICINSSDVGRASFNVTFFIWKRVCTNGMCISKVGGQLYHQRHMGITAGEVRRELAANLKMIPTLIERSEDIIKASRNKVVDLKDEHVFQKMVSDIRKKAQVSEEEAKAVLKLAEEQYDLSLWGIGNAMTLKAQEYELDKRIVIETAAGSLIA